MSEERRCQECRQLLFDNVGERCRRCQVSARQMKDLWEPSPDVHVSLPSRTKRRETRMARMTEAIPVFLSFLGVFLSVFCLVLDGVGLVQMEDGHRYLALTTAALSGFSILLAMHHARWMDMFRKRDDE